jgi:hypothetical protein
VSRAHAQELLESAATPELTEVGAGPPTPSHGAATQRPRRKR